MSIYEQRQGRLLAAVVAAEASYYAASQAALRAGRAAPVRHKCFVSYHSSDLLGVTEFVEAFRDVFIPRVVGVSDSDQFGDPIGSDDEDYVKAQIAARYLSDSTVTILFAGKCAWSRKYVDWELSSSLRDDPVNKRNGLLAITPADRSVSRLPERFHDNFDAEGSRYARYYYFPRSATELAAWIDDAFAARESRAGVIDNSRKLRRVNSTCI